MNLSENWLLQMYEINIIAVSELNLMHNMSKLFNKTFLKEQLLPNYANIKNKTKTVDATNGQLTET